MNKIQQQENFSKEKRIDHRVVTRMVLIFTSVVIFFLIFTILLVESSYYNVASEDEYELKSVHLLFRHGDRTPDNPTYPLDPHINETYEPYGHGQMTKTGYFRMFDNGKYFRRRYKNFMGPKYDPTEVHAQSTDKDRTKLSLNLFAAGMFFPGRVKIAFNSKFSWPPLVFASPKLNNDPVLFPLGKPCTRFVTNFYKNYKSVLAENEQLFSNLSELTGKSFENAYDIISLASVLDTQVEYGLKLPAWTVDYYPEKIHKLKNEAWGYFLHDSLSKRIFGGHFLQKLITDWEAKIANETPEKLSIFSAHDGTLVGALGAFNLWDTKEAPDYGITAIFELKQNQKTGMFGVQIYVKNKDDNEPILRIIPGCQSFCPLHQLKFLLHDHMPTASDCYETDSKISRK